MIEQITQIHLFYPLLALVLIVLIVAIAIVIIKTKDNGLFNNIFNRHVEEHEDTTDKMKDMHDNVVHVKFGVEHEKELDYLEKSYDKLVKDVEALDKKIDLVLKRVIALEKRNS